MSDHRTWYIEARVGSQNIRGREVRFIDDRRGTDGGYTNEPAEEAFATLRDALAKAREEVERTDRAYLDAIQRALAAERARDEAVRERDEQARLRQIAEDAIPKGLAVGVEFVRAEADRERDEAVAALRLETALSRSWHERCDEAQSELASALRLLDEAKIPWVRTPAAPTLASIVKSPNFRKQVDALVAGMSVKCRCGKESHEHFTNDGCDGFMVDIHKDTNE